MTALRQRMIEEMVLRGLAKRTQQSHVCVVAHLARHYCCSPDQLDAAQVRAWLLHRISERHLAYATANQAVCAMKFFSGTVLGREAEAVSIPYAHAPCVFRAKFRDAHDAARRTGWIPDGPQGELRAWPACPRAQQGIGGRPIGRDESTLAVSAPAPRCRDGPS